MRILMVVYNRVGKGTYWRALQLARVLARHGCQVTVLATGNERSLRTQTQHDESGVTIVHSPNVLGGPLSAGWDPLNLLARLIWSFRHQSANYDIVHGFECRPTVIFPSLFWQRRRDATLILDWCDWFGRDGSVAERKNPVARALLRPVETFFEEHFRTWAAGTTVINTLLRQFAVDLGIPSEEIFDLPNGSDTERLRPIPMSEARTAVGLADDAPIVCYIGAAFERDGKLMAAAFNHLHRQLPDAKLLLAGYCNVPVEAWIEEPESVIRTGNISNREVNLYLAAANLCWLPLCNSGANRGRFPLKVHDYIAAGRPVVGTDVGDLGDFIRKGRFGLAVQDNPEEIGAAALTLLRYPDEQVRLGKRARVFAETEATWAQAGEGLLAFYRKIQSDQNT